MKKSVIIAVVVLVALGTAGIVWALQKSGSKTSTNSGAAQTGSMQNERADEVNNQNMVEAAMETNKVSISNFEFTPAKIKIKKGTKVTWTNEDTIRHDVKPDNVTEEFKVSEMLGKGKSHSVTFNTVGTYSYHCSPHPYMKGIVEVVE